MPGLTSLRQGYGGPPKRYAKAKDPRYIRGYETVLLLDRRRRRFRRIGYRKRHQLRRRSCRGIALPLYRYVMGTPVGGPGEVCTYQITAPVFLS